MKFSLVSIYRSYILAQTKLPRGHSTSAIHRFHICCSSHVNTILQSTLNLHDGKQGNHQQKMSLKTFFFIIYAWSMQQSTLKYYKDTAPWLPKLNVALTICDADLYSGPLFYSFLFQLNEYILPLLSLHDIMISPDIVPWNKNISFMFTVLWC